MLKICFVCHGNICRSPLAEYLFKYLINKDNISDKFTVISRATSIEEIGNDIYPLIKKELDKNHIPYQKHYATQISEEEIKEYDYIIAMDKYNLSSLKTRFSSIYRCKIHLLNEFRGQSNDIIDPWYSRKFSLTYEDIYIALMAFLSYLKENEPDLRKEQL